MSDFAEFLSFRADIKSVGDDDGPGEFEAILSTPQVDRENESVKAGALTLPDSLPIYVDHDWRTGALPVAKAVPSYVNGEIHVKGVYARHARAQDVRQLVTDRIIDSMSVGFLNGKRSRDQKSGVTAVTAGDAFEGSFTGIPINTGARVLASKAVESMKAGARNSSTDSSRLQQIHDLSVENGAACGSTKSIDDSAVKAIVGSVEAQQDRVRDALEDAYGEWSAWLRGVLPDTVVFDKGGDTFQQSYTDDGAVVTLEGDPTEVDIHEVVAPDADADREANEPDPGVSLLAVTPKNPLTTKATGDAAAQAAADPAADEVAQAKARIRLRTVAATH
jgi:hypothetical protein